MNHRSKFLVQTCYSITHSIAFRSHLTSKWSLQTPDESDPGPSLNSFQFGIHVGYLTNGTGSFWQAHWFGVMDSGDKCRPELFRNTPKEFKVRRAASLRYSPQWSIIELCSLFFFSFLFHYSIKEHDRSEGDRFLLHNTCWIWRTNVIVGCHGRVAVRLHSSEYDFWSLRKY